VSLRQVYPGPGWHRHLPCRLRTHAPLAACAVLLENTGHYHRALAEALLDKGVAVYFIAVKQKRANGLDKSDRRDALRLGNHLYNQLALGLQVSERTQQVRSMRAPTTDAAAQLQGLVRRHYELMQGQTRLRNKLTALCDEIFPEYLQVFPDVNAAVALDLREKFPTRRWWLRQV